MKINPDFIIKNRDEVFKYFKSRLPIFHNSNVFFRDIQFAIRDFMELKTIRISYDESEVFANLLISVLVQDKILIKVNRFTYVVNYLDFKEPSPNIQPV